MYEYYCLNPISAVGLDKFPAKYENTECMQEADAILVRSADMHKLEVAEKTAAVARAGAGVNNIPLEKMTKKGVVVFNTPGANANGVKEMVIAGMLLASRDIIGGIEWLEKQDVTEDIAKKAEKQKKQFAGCEISGKKLGIIGLGAIGVRVANAAIHLGMEVYGYDPYISVDAAWNLSRSIYHINDINMIYRDCDYITIHVPLTDSTKKMIGKEEIAQMKDDVVLLNFARDLLVDEEAVCEALKDGKMKKYVTDFANPTVANAPNTLVTPHLGASTEESEDNCAVMAVKQLMDYLENGNIKNSVNYPSCDGGTCIDAGRLTINHKNIPNMISQFTKVLGDAGVNIANMINKSKGDYAYTMIDVTTPISKEVAQALKAIEEVYRVRIIK
ncbi:MAG: phosphoglycerate dehydrogenase [Bacillota bacterium]|nr:phosphoglycerate dehydrogenase [Bacillota bacterium]